MPCSRNSWTLGRQGTEQTRPIRLFLVVAGFGALASSAAPVPAQQLTGPQVGDRLRITLEPGLYRVVCVANTITPQAILCDGGSSVRLDYVSHVEISRGRSSRVAGGLIGLLAGAGLGVVIGTLQGGHGDLPGYFVQAAYASLGGLVGAIVGIEVTGRERWADIGNFASAAAPGRGNGIVVGVSRSWGK